MMLHRILDRNICSYEGPSALLLEQILGANEGAKPLHIEQQMLLRSII